MWQHVRQVQVGRPGPKSRRSAHSDGKLMTDHWLPFLMTLHTGRPGDPCSTSSTVCAAISIWNHAKLYSHFNVEPRQTVQPFQCGTTPNCTAISIWNHTKLYSYFNMEPRKPLQLPLRETTQNCTAISVWNHAKLYSYFCVEPRQTIELFQCITTPNCTAISVYNHAKLYSYFSV